MRKNKKCLIILLVVVLLTALSLGLCGMTVLKEGYEDIKVGSISDLHYYPTYFSYPESAEDYSLSAFKRKGESEDKLLVESSINLKSTLDSLSKQNIDYLLVTGDLSSDGERQALIDVANALRKFQNDMRATKPNFQVVVVPGNHDIANSNSRDYTTLEGESVPNVDKQDFAKIFAGLGYPNMSEDEALKYYTDQEYKNIENLKYMPYETNGQAYVSSTLAKNVEVKYASDLEQNELTYVLTSGDTTIVALDTLNVGKVSGMWSDGLDKWLRDNVPANKNMLSLSHHNIIEHFGMQEQYMSEYLVSDYEVARQTLLDLGVHYHFSGHIHANDIANFVDYSGRIIYDLVTPSIVSAGAGYRISEIYDYTSGDSNINTVVNDITNVDYTSLVEEGYLVGEDIAIVSNVANYAYDKILAKYGTNIMTDYAKGVVPMLKSIFAGLATHIPDNPIIDRQTVIDNVDLLVDNFVSEINQKVLDDYKFKTTDKDLVGEEHKFNAILYDMGKVILDQKVDSKHTLEDMFVYAYNSYLVGEHFESLDETVSWFKNGVEKLKQRNVVYDIFHDIIREHYQYLTKLITTPLDLTAGVPGEVVDKLNTVLKFADTTLNEVRIDKVAEKILDVSGRHIPSVTAELDKLVAQYVTENYAQSLGRGAAEILTSLAVDQSFDGERNGKMCAVKYQAKDSYSVSAQPIKTTASIEDGRLPSMLTNTFGLDPTSTRELVWYTDVSVEGSDIDLKNADGVNISTAKEIVQYNYADGAFGKGLRQNTKTLMKHSVSLSGLKPNTTYEYRVGDKANNYWSESYTFTTAPIENESFEILLISDTEGLFESDYDSVHGLLASADKVFEDHHYDFIVNLGDFVANGMDMKQWRYALDKSQSVFGETGTILVGGGNDHLGIDKHIAQPKTAGKDYFSFEYSGVHFVVLDTNDMDINGLSKTQLDWLIADLDSAEQMHKVVFMNKGIYTAGPHHNDSDIVALREQLTSVFADGGVDIVLQGYDQVYSESQFLDRDGEVVGSPYELGSPINNNGGVLYICIGSSGSIFNEYDKNVDLPIHRGANYQTPRLNNPVFGKLVFDGENISFYSYQYDIDNGSISELNPLLLWWIKLIIGLSVTACVIAIIVITVVVIKKKRINSHCTIQEIAIEDVEENVSKNDINQSQVETQETSEKNKENK